MLRKTAELNAQKHVKVNAKEKTAELNANKHVKLNAQKNR
jgi:uncharacterized protein (DUF2345 family)